MAPVPAQCTQLSSLSSLSSVSTASLVMSANHLLCTQQQGPYFPHHHPLGSCHGKAQWPDKHLWEVPAYLTSCWHLGQSALRRHSLKPSFCSLQYCHNASPKMSGASICPRGGRHETCTRGNKNAVESTCDNSSNKLMQKLESVTEMRGKGCVLLNWAKHTVNTNKLPLPPLSQMISRFLLKK
jgi:hypothetical protein